MPTLQGERRVRDGGLGANPLRGQQATPVASPTRTARPVAGVLLECGEELARIEQALADLGHGWLGPRAAQVSNGGVGGTTYQRCCRRSPRCPHSGRVTSWLASQNLDSDLLRLGPITGQQLGCPRVCLGACARRQLLIHRRAHQRMQELQRPAVSKQLSGQHCAAPERVSPLARRCARHWTSPTGAAPPPWRHALATRPWPPARDPGAPEPPACTPWPPASCGFRLAAQSLTNRDIAQALFITTKTVSDHLSSAYRKLNITSRDELTTALVADRP
jgi:hypothetical protein